MRDPSLRIGRDLHFACVSSQSNPPVPRLSSRVAEPASAPAACSSMPTRASRGAAAQAGALAKVTQVGRVQRGKARIERRHLGRNRIQRQNRTREQQVPRHANHARNTFLHQPSMRNICH